MTRIHSISLLAKRATLIMWAMLIALALPSVVSAQTGPFDAKGVLPRHDYTSPLPFEHIDIATGSLVLTFTDLVLPGNAGRELRFQRTYNSKELGGGAWTFGIAGVPMGVSIQGPLNGPGVPTFMMPDGGTRSTPLELGTPPPPILEYTGNESFWVYEASTSTLKMPDGTVCVFGSRGLSYFSDPFGNTVQLLYDYPAVDQVTVRQALGGTEFRDVVLTYAPATQQSLPADLPLSMSFAGREWTYSPIAAAFPDGPRRRSPCRPRIKPSRRP